jgi:hypothetical protein
MRINLLASFEYARCIELFRIVIVAVRAGLDLPRVAEFTVEKT